MLGGSRWGRKPGGDNSEDGGFGRRQIAGAGTLVREAPLAQCSREAERSLSVLSDTTCRVFVAFVRHAKLL